MREILFRGQDAATGDWIKGFYVHLFDTKGNDSHRIYSGYAETDCEDYYPDFWEVDPETVGQFTGLTDKNGKKIFEGDIVKMSFEGTSREYDGDWSECYFDVDFDGHKIGVVTFGGYGTFLKVSHGELFVDGEKIEDWKPARKSRLAAYRSEVIGNIHDNPELLEG